MIAVKKRRLRFLFARKTIKGFPNAELLSVYRDHGVVRKSSRDDNNNRPGEDLSSYLLVAPNDLVVNKMKAWQGSVAISQFHGIVSPAYFVFTPISEESSKYLHYLFRSAPMTAMYAANSKGIRPNQWDLDIDAFLNLSVSLPSYSDQDAIANFLDRETADADALVAKYERLVELLEEKRVALITWAVTKGIDQNVPMKDSNVEWLGDVPQEWEIVAFRYCGTISEGQIDPTDIRFRDVILIAPNHVESGTGRLLYMETAVEQAAISGKYRVQNGDVVYSKIRPALNKATLAKMDCLCSADMYPIRPSNRVRPDFLLCSMLAKPFASLTTEVSMRVAMPKINRDTLAGIPMAIPPIEEQQQIVAHISVETSKIDHTISTTRKAIALAREHRSALITAAVTGQIDVGNYRSKQRPVEVSA